MNLADQFLEGADIAQLRAAAQDYRFLLGRGYPQLASLTLVGNRYNLSGAARQLLRRGVCDPAAAVQRRLKLRPVQTLSGQPLALDGHNVLITLECAFRGVPLVAADDGFVRDIGQVSKKFSPSPLTEQVLYRLSRYLIHYGVGPVTFYYDAPMSRSGELAATTRRILKDCELAGDAQAIPAPEKRLLECQGVIGSSDAYLIDRSGQMADVAGEIIRQLPQIQIMGLTAEAV